MTINLKTTLSLEAYSLEQMELNYLYSTFIRFGSRKKVDILDSKSVHLSGVMLVDFYEQLEKTLKELIVDCYEEPDHKNRSKYPGRYEKISFEERTYVVDYTLSRVGRLMFLIYLRLIFIRKIIDGDGTLILDAN